MAKNRTLYCTVEVRNGAEYIENVILSGGFKNGSNTTAYAHALVG